MRVDATGSAASGLLSVVASESSDELVGGLEELGFSFTLGRFSVSC